MAAPFIVSRSPPMGMLLNPLIWILWILDFAVWLVLAVLWPPTFFRHLATMCGFTGIFSYEQSK